MKLDTILLFALPASGKSEVRTYLDSLSAEQCQEEMHIGQTLQLDDYPYVHFMHRIDDELAKRGLPYQFYKGPDRPFLDEFEWGTLMALLNEDYDNLINNRTFNPPSAAQHLFDRLDNAHEKVGLPRGLGELPYRIRCEMADVMEEECRRELDVLNKTCSQPVEGRTIFIEAARGGPNGSAFPLTPPYGYAYALSQLSETILERAGILYVWVTPADSRRKNIERARPNAQGSILHHSVPMEVMLGQYGCDDMEYLRETSSKPDTVQLDRLVEVKAPDGEARYELKTWHLPLGVFDNRGDLTSFIRNETWKPEEIAPLHNGLKSALDKVFNR